MMYQEINNKDLFTVPEEYYLAHCISADFALGAGIAVLFCRKFDMRNKLRAKYPNYLNKYIINDYKGECILEGRTFNLITKERCFHKPTYESLRMSLGKMRDICLELGITKLAMPKIGCGIDGLSWSTVSTMIQDVFKDTEIEIIVCIFEN